MIGHIGSGVWEEGPGLLAVGRSRLTACRCAAGGLHRPAHTGPEPDMPSKPL